MVLLTSKPTLRTYLMLPWLLFIGLFIIYQDMYTLPDSNTVAPSWVGWLFILLFAGGSFSMKIVSISADEITLTRMLTRRKKTFSTADIESIRLSTRKSGIIQFLRLLKPTRLVMIKFSGERPDFIHLSSMLNSNTDEIREFLAVNFPDRTINQDMNRRF